MVSPAAPVSRAVRLSRAVPVSPVVPVNATAPTFRPARRLRLARYAVIGALAVFSVGAISYVLAPAGDRGRLLLPMSGGSSAPSGPAAPGIGATGSDEQPGASAPATIAVDDEPVVVEIGERQEFGGLMGTYAWTSLAFPGDRVTVRWTASASSKGDCAVTWRVEAVNEDALSGTIDVEAGDDETGNGRYDTPFGDARFMVDSSCVTWSMSMEGFATSAMLVDAVTPSRP